MSTFIIDPELTLNELFSEVAIAIERAKALSAAITAGAVTEDENRQLAYVLDDHIHQIDQLYARCLELNEEQPARHGKVISISSGE